MTVKLKKSWKHKVAKTRRRIKKGSKGHLKKQADKLFSLLIRKRGYCERCGETEYSKLQCCHVIGRRNLRLRWDPKNALCMCYRDHIHFQHKEPLQFTDWFQKKYPDRYKYLMKAKDEIKKMTLDDYKELVGALQSQLNSF